MAELLFHTFLGSIIFTFLIFLFLGTMFYQENEKGAVQKVVVLAFLFLFIGLLIIQLQQAIVIYTIYAIILAIIILFLFPFKEVKDLTDEYPKKKYDERDIMFSRRELIPGNEKYKAYYAENPEKEELDSAFRKEPGLLSPHSAYYNQKAFDQANDNFSRIEPLHQYIEGNVNPKKTILSAQEYTNLIKSRAKKLGALDVGITLTKPHHFYSHKGRRNEYGNKIENDQRYAIAFTVEMNHEMVMAAPQASIIVESSRQYLQSGIIATQIAEVIRTLGYEALPHIDGNYQVVCPLVARDAGLGEIGRMGLLMTPNHGPRVRIAVITTDLELIPDTYQKNHSVIDFCSLCKKCADCCPSQSISIDEPKEFNGVTRWKIDSESCYTFWCKAGTDCGRCIAVCPYAHPNHSLHKIIRWGIQYSKVFRLIAVYLDDFFYGKKPAPKPMPKEFDS